MLKILRLMAFMALSTTLHAQTIPSANADEFGDRFWNQGAAGFGEPVATLDKEFNDTAEDQLMATDMDAAAEALQNIMPAAGEETTEQDTKTDNAVE